MTYTNKLVFLVAALLLAVFEVSAVSALGTINHVEVNGVDAAGGVVNVASFAGDVLPVRVEFTADQTVDDVRVKAWISGGREYSAVTERFDVLQDSTYSRLVSVQMPSNIDPSESLELNVVVEARNGDSIETTVSIAAQRESYVVDVLDVAMDSKVKAGSSLALDIVLKNRGRHLAEDTFVRASIPALGIEAKGYFGDLSSVDTVDPDKEDAAERRLVLRIPSDAPAGVYTVEIEAYNGDSVTTTVRKVAVVGAGADTSIVSSGSSKTFAAGEKAVYSLTLVNSGDKIRVYSLVLDTPTGLTVTSDDSVLAVPAGSSRTVKLEVSAAKAGKYNFGVNVHSDGALVQSVNYMASVEGSKIAGGNATVLLTVILAIIFVVLLVVLIVLLTRKPKKSEEFGESYY